MGDLDLGKILEWGGRVISAGNGLLAIIFFFMPWVTASCGGQELLSMSGWELAKGTTVQGEHVNGSPMLFFVLAMAVLVIILAAIPWRETMILGSAVALLGAFGALFVLSMAIGSSDRHQAAAMGIEIRYKAGFYGTILAYLGIVFGGGMMAIAQFVRGRKSAWLQGAIAGMGASPGPRSGPDAYGYGTRRPQQADTPPPPPSPVRDVSSDLPAFVAPSVPPPDEEKTKVDGIAAGPPKAILRFQRGPWAGQKIPIYGDNILLGRGSACDVRIPDKFVSRSHARLRFAHGQWFIQDQDSTGGTYVNGQRVGATRLQSGDLVRLGKQTEFLFVTK